MRFQCSEDLSVDTRRNGNNTHSIHATGYSTLCKYFVSGICNRGSQCLYAHSLQGDRPPCKFFFSLKGCRNGEACFYSHDFVPSNASHNEANSCVPEDDAAYPELLLRFFSTPGDRSVLLFNDNGFYFSSRIVQIYDPLYIITTTSLQCEPTIEISVNRINILWGVSHPYQTILSKVGNPQVPWNDIECVVWFPQFQNGLMQEQKSVLKAFFEYMAIWVIANALFEVKVIVSMSNIIFSQFQVSSTKSAAATSTEDIPHGATSPLKKGRDKLR